MTHIRALVFDVFGTLVDWRSGVALFAEQQLAPLGVRDDWLAFADDWRAQYQPAMEEVRTGRLGYQKLDTLHRRNLDVVLRARGHHAINDATRVKLNLAWHTLPAWPDVGPGLAALRQQFLLAPCSNGHIGLMANLARHNAWHWDAILGAELAQDYKPKAVVYTTAAAAFDLAPHEVMMVAAHSNDLQAAAACGLRTGFVARPDEYGPDSGETRASFGVDFEATDLMHLARLLRLE
ncbi:MAG: haloacid dehalogenase type II [Burkholderiaceae bacterium]